MGWSKVVAVVALLSGPGCSGSGSSNETTGGQGGGGSGGGGSGGEPALTNVVVAQLKSAACLARSLPRTLGGSATETEQVSCLLSSATFPAAGAPCACATQPTTPSVTRAIRENAEASGLCGGGSGSICASLCACDLPQLAGAALTQCLDLVSDDDRQLLLAAGR